LATLSARIEALGSTNRVSSIVAKPLIIPVDIMAPPLVFGSGRRRIQCSKNAYRIDPGNDDIDGKQALWHGLIGDSIQIREPRQAEQAADF
jgi:hypothetical protein